MQTKMQLYRGLILCLMTILSLGGLAGLIYGAIWFSHVTVPNCIVTNGTVTVFTIGDYIPPISNRKWIDIDILYPINGNNYTQHIFIDLALQSDCDYFTEMYAPVGRIVQGSYDVSNPSGVSDGGCIMFSWWSMVFGFTVPLYGLICCLLCSVVYHKLERMDEQRGNLLTGSSIA